MVVNVHRVRIDWGDCDPARIVFYPNYFRWFDQATSRLFESVGLPWSVLFRSGDITGLPLVSVKADFRTPSRYGDEIEIESHVSEWRRRTLVIKHLASNNGTLAVEAEEIRACVGPRPDDPDGIRAVPIPDAIKRRFDPGPARD